MTNSLTKFLTKFFQLFLIPFCLLPLPFTVQANSLPQYPFIHATGNASISVPADVAELEFDIRSLAVTPHESSQQLEAMSKEFVQFLANNQINSSDIETYDTKKMVSDDETVANEKSPVRYRLLRSFHFVVKNLDQWKTLTDFLLSRTYLGNLSATFGRSDLNLIRQHLLAAAIANAKENAKTMADGLGVKLGNASAISETPLAKIASVMGFEGNSANLAGIISSEKPPQLDSVDLSIPSALHYKNAVDVVFKMK